MGHPWPSARSGCSLALATPAMANAVAGRGAAILAVHPDAPHSSLYQEPPPPPPPPPPEKPPPLNPLPPDDTGVGEMVPDVVTAKPSIESEKLPTVNGWVET